MENKYTYLFLDMVTIIGPLALSFDKKVAFYKSWKHFIISMLPVSLFYIIWDILFTETGVWRFNSEYLIGNNIVNLPIEEYIFFTVVPYACLFIYACLRAYFPKLNKQGKIWFYPILLLSIFMSVFYYKKTYTVVTFGLLAIVIIYLLLKEERMLERIGTYLFLSWVVALIPMAYVNGILTSKPVLIYNNIENCSLRIGTIPFEDFFYNMLYMTLMIVIFEKLNKTQIT
jgi:lycopene cyclase domain-containing protein